MAKSISPCVNKKPGIPTIKNAKKIKLLQKMKISTGTPTKDMFFEVDK